ALVDFTLYATLNWNAPFYNRVFGLSMTEIAGHLALLSGVGGGLGGHLRSALVDFTLYATLNWNAPFYNRVFGLSMTEIAGHLALLSGVGGGLGVYLGGALTDRLGRRDARWYMWVPAIAALAAVPV